MCGVKPRDILDPTRVKHAEALVPELLCWIEAALRYGHEIPGPLLPLIDDQLHCNRGVMKHTAHGANVKVCGREIAYWYRWNQFDKDLPATHTLISMTSTGLHLAVVDDFGTLVRCHDAQRGRPCAE